MRANISVRPCYVGQWSESSRASESQAMEGAFSAGAHGGAYGGVRSR